MGGKITRVKKQINFHPLKILIQLYTVKIDSSEFFFFTLNNNKTFEMKNRKPEAQHSAQIPIQKISLRFPVVSGYLSKPRGSFQCTSRLNSDNASNTNKIRSNCKVKKVFIETSVDRARGLSLQKKKTNFYPLNLEERVFALKWSTPFI